ncbi:hypothetical protein GCM10027175_20380 [Hymenobacter latericoloratus]
MHCHQYSPGKIRRKAAKHGFYRRRTTSRTPNHYYPARGQGCGRVAFENDSFWLNY